MKRLTVPMALIVLASGCQTGPVPSLYKAGSTFPQRQAAYDQCKIASLREIPQALSTEVSGGYYNPGTTQCSTAYGVTSCNQVGRVDIAPSSSTVDQNAGLRERYIGRCMSSQGFVFLPRNTCSSNAERIAARDNPQPASASEFTCNSGMNLYQ